ncbi:MAG: phosphoribosyltransferase [Bacteriovoracaceae bacterium]|nr:phosphoribosyltransferase [Bacteriovoracaceae bacterium]
MADFFDDRTQAGQKLLSELKKLNLKSPLIIALPRGGVVLAAEIAKFYKTTADILLVRKIGAPFNSELAVGAVVEGNPPQTSLNQELIRVLKVDVHYLDVETKKQLEEIKRQDQLYRAGRKRASVKDATVVLVDDGVATGASIRAGLRGLRHEKPARLILAVPVAPLDTVKELEKEVDDLICLTSPEDFKAVGQFYRDFRQVTDDEVKRLLAEK